MPPALRRIASSPTVRSAAAPYPPTSPSSSTASASAVARTRPGRRRGVSDANSRRVLADIEWWRVMQGQREEDRERGNERGDGPDATEPSGLYTLREDPSTLTLTHVGGHSRGVSDASSDDSYPPSSTDSTPPRAPSLPPLDTAALTLGIPMASLFTPRRPHIRRHSRAGSVTLSTSSSSSLPPPPTTTGTHAHTGIFSLSALAPPPNTLFAHAPSSLPPPHTIRLPHMDADLDVGVYTAGHVQRHRHRSASFPGTTVGGPDDGNGAAPAAV